MDLESKRKYDPSGNWALFNGTGHTPLGPGIYIYLLVDLSLPTFSCLRFVQTFTPKPYPYLSPSSFLLPSLCRLHPREACHPKPPPTATPVLDASYQGPRSPWPYMCPLPPRPLASALRATAVATATRSPRSCMRRRPPACPSPRMRDRGRAHRRAMAMLCWHPSLHGCAAPSGAHVGRAPLAPHGLVLLPPVAREEY